MDNLTAAFDDHCTERNRDMAATVNGPYAPELGENSAGVMTNLGKCPSDPGQDSDSTCSYDSNWTAVETSNCKDFSLPDSRCYAASFAQVEDLLEQARYYITTCADDSHSVPLVLAGD